MIEIIVSIILAIITFYLGYLLGKYLGKQAKTKEALKKSRQVLTGQIGEQFAPYLPNFPADPNSVQFIGKPIDYIAFEKDKITFIEVKSQNAKLNSNQQQIKHLIKNKKVEFKEYRVPKQ